MEQKAAKTRTSHNFGIRSHFINKLPKPYSNCDLHGERPNTEYARILHEKNMTYTQQFCFELGKTSILFIDDFFLMNEISITCLKVLDIVSFQRCGCSGSTRWFKYMRNCANEYELQCLNKVINEDLYNKFYGEFDDACPLECNSYYYTISESSESFPNSYYASFLLQNYPVFEKNSRFNRSLTIEDIKGSVSKINIYLEDMRVNRITEFPSMSVMSLISNIGGLLGLFLGMSLLSLIEVIELALKIFTSKKTNPK